MIDQEALNLALIYANTFRSSKDIAPCMKETEHVLDLMFSASQILAVYGSLMPGKENHHLLSDINGAWEKGFVKGQFHDGGWGAGLGYPSLIWDPAGEEIPVYVLVSNELPAHWDRLDHFEGVEYVRIFAPVYQYGKVRWVANIYESASKGTYKKQFLV